jgi:hypothetical protein
MKSGSLALLSAVVLAAPFCGYAEHLIPAGSLISCTLSEPKINSKTAAIGDPVLCQIGHSERYGRFVLPYDSYLVGRFEDYRDPGHLVGKGWMELRFDRMVIEPDTVLPIDARVVDVPGYSVDNHGRIIGKGHAVRDTVTWMIPVLWPIDMINLPRRGPRPTLKEETRLTLKVMDDLGIPNDLQPSPPQRDSNGLVHRTPSAYTEPPPPPPDDQPIAADDPPQEAPAPEPSTYADYSPAPPPQVITRYVPVPVAVAPPAPVYWYPAPQVVTAWAPPPRTVVVYRNGYAYPLTVH